MEGPETLIWGDFIHHAQHPTKQQRHLHPFSCREQFPWGQQWRKGSTSCSDAQAPQELSPSCLLPLGDSVVLTTELMIHSWGVGSFPEGLEERKKTRRGRSPEERSSARRLQPEQRRWAQKHQPVSKGKEEREKSEGWCQCQAHSFSEGQEDHIYVLKPLAQEHCTYMQLVSFSPPGFHLCTTQSTAWKSIISARCLEHRSWP